MNSKIVTALALTAASLAIGARSQTTNPVAAPAPSVSASIAPPAAASVAAAPNQIVYAPRLPSVADLTNAAAAQGLTIEKIEQTSADITVVYKYANGQSNTVAYRLLPPAGSTTSAVATPNSPAPPVVVYQPAPRVIYYDDYGPGYYYDPFYWYPPFSVRLGFGYHYGGFRHRR